MTLAAGVAALGLTLPAGAEAKLAAYLALLTKWNRSYNLTAIRDPAEMVTHHLLDSLAVIAVVEKSALAERCPLRLVDVGSGAGLPGLVLAIARPDWEIVSVEAVEKKAAFQRQAKIELEIANAKIHCGRVEAFEERFDAAISRAFASLADFVQNAGHLADCLLAMKGIYPDGEIAALPAGWRVSACKELVVPGINAQRHLLQLERT